MISAKIRIPRKYKKKHIDENVRIERKKLPREAMYAYLFVGIPIVAYIIFTLIPLAISFVMQFTSMEGFDLASMKWNSFENFKYVFKDKDFYLSIGVTLLLSVNQFISLFIALFISVLLAKKPFGHKVFQVIYFIPYICSSVAVSLMWMWMFNADTGIVNSILEAIGGPSARVDWFNDKAAYPWMIIIACVWQAPGYGIVMYKAALSQVNPSLYEAGDIDGASPWKKLTKITLPAIAPTTFFLLMTGIIAGLQIFDMAKLFSDGTWLGTAGPENIGLSTVLYIYKTFYDFNELPRASVMSWALFIIIFIVSVINFKLRNKWVDEA